ncbi:MAG: cytochrome c oxidase subunit II [Armatimonadia bacterium]|nr:cytochrome c oxidase subunit II [Armatimonadia bacterium]
MPMVFALSSVSEVADKVDDAFLWIGGICVVLLIGITAAMVLFVFKFNRRRNPKATQIEGNTLLEVTWIVIPTFIVLFMFFKGYEGFKLMRSVPEGAVTVRVVAQSWFWTFVYPDGNFSSPELYAPRDRPIRLELTAPKEDVVHSFYLPAFRVKEDCVPGRENYMWFEARTEGEYNIFCAEYCGKDHSKMISTLHVLPPDEYDAWVDMKIADKNKPVVMEKAMDPDSPEIRERDGDALYETYCVSCHGKEGRGGLVEGARDFRDLSEWKRSPKITDIYRTLAEGIEGTQMRSFSQLPPWDRFALAHKVASFYTGEDRPEATPEEIEKLKEEYRLGEKPEKKERISIEEAMDAMAREERKEE